MPDLTVSVSRAKWLRGPGDPGYLASDGRFTCLGAILLESGIPYDVLRRTTSIGCVPKEYVLRVPLPLVDSRGGSTPAAYSLQRFNMEGGIPGEEREKNLTDIARKCGIQLEFTE